MIPAPKVVPPTLSKASPPASAIQPTVPESKPPKYLRYDAPRLAASISRKRKRIEQMKILLTRQEEKLSRREQRLKEISK